MKSFPLEVLEKKEVAMDIMTMKNAIMRAQQSSFFGCKGEGRRFVFFVITQLIAEMEGSQESLIGKFGNEGKRI
jgi:hypothetical protein